MRSPYRRSYGRGLLTLVLAALVTMPILGHPTESRSQHFVLTDQDELEAVAERARTGSEPWASAYDRVIESANQALSISARSVVDNGAPTNGDIHAFGNEIGRAHV